MSVATTEQDLLDAIIAAPDDDAPRLVYADHLARRDEARAELIHLQCEPTAGPAHDERIAQLLTGHSPAWLAPLLALDLDAHFEIRRGFVHTMSGRMPAATLRARELADLAPLLWHLHLTVHGQRDRVELARPRGTAVLARAVSLSIVGKHRGRTRDARGPIADLAGLAAVPWQRLRSLEVSHLRVDVRELVALLATPALTSLTELRLSLRFGPAEMRALVAGLPLARLRSLDVTGNQLDEATAGELSQYPALVVQRDLPQHA